MSKAQLTGDSSTKREYEARLAAIVMLTTQEIMTLVVRLLDMYSILVQERYHGVVKDNRLFLFQPLKLSTEQVRWRHKSVLG